VVRHGGHQHFPDLAHQVDRLVEVQDEVALAEVDPFRDTRHR
jgi:hypothetical protein